MTEPVDQDSKAPRTCSNGFPIVDGYNCCNWWKNDCDPCFDVCLNEATVTDLMKENNTLRASCKEHMNTIGELTQDVEKLEVELERLRPIIELAQRASSQSCTCDDLFALREELEKIVGEP